MLSRQFCRCSIINAQMNVCRCSLFILIITSAIYQEISVELQTDTE